MILEISEEARHIHAEHGFVIIKEKSTELGRVPLDTITAVIISAQGATLSKTLLSRLAGLNIPVVICGPNYMPVSMALPVSAHYKQLEIAQAQISATESLKKSLWRSIVQAKLYNQAAVLQQHFPESVKVCERILLFGRKTTSGDPDNYEANAARLYWPAMFGEHFIRNTDEEGANAMLNYVYAVLRACVARAICAAGLLPLFGVFHHNKLNPFCLADDLMEPMRPFGDELVLSMFSVGQENALTPKAKRTLCSIIEHKVSIDGKSMHFIPMTYAVAQSLAKSFLAGKNQIVLPSGICRS